MVNVRRVSKNHSSPNKTKKMNRALASIQRVRFPAPVRPTHFVRPSFSRLPVFQSTSIVRPPRTFQPKQINNRMFHTSRILKSEIPPSTKTERISNIIQVIAFGPFFAVLIIAAGTFFFFLWLEVVGMLFGIILYPFIKLMEKLERKQKKINEKRCT